MTNLGMRQSVSAAPRPAGGPDPQSRLKEAGITAGRNSLFLVLAQAGGKLAALLVFLLLVRYLSVAEVGKFSFALTFVGIFSALTDWGISTWMMREVSRRRGEASRWFSAALYARVVTFALWATAGLGIAWATKVPVNTWVIILILFLAMLPDVLGQTLGFLFLAFERAGASALLTGLTDWSRLLFVFAILHLAPGLSHVAWSYALATFVAALVVYLTMARKLVGLMVRPSLDDLKKVARGGVPFLLVGVFFRIYFRADTILLAYLKGDYSVGTYNAAYKLMEALIFIPAAFMGAIFPLLARSFERDADQFRAGCRMAIRVLASMGFPLGVGTMLIAPKLIARLYGPQYDSSALYLQVLIWTASLIFLNATFPASLNAVGREKYSLAAVVTGIVLNIAGNLILIPRLDALGAAIMTVATEVYSTLLYLHFFRRFLFSPGILGLVWRPLLASAFMGLAVYWALSWPLTAVVGLGVLSYTLCLAAIGGIRRQEVELGLAVLKLSRG
jgi:O-antigen/teichoic acid export membrane protein